MKTTLCICICFLANIGFAENGTIRVLDGTINGTALNISYPEVTLNQGQALTGSFSVGVQNDRPGSAITPLAATTTWGDPPTSYWGINSWVVPGYTEHTVNVNVTAPTVNGTYYIAVALSGVYDYDQLMSGTHPAWSAVWGTGHEVALLPSSTFEDAITNGVVPFSLYRPGMEPVFEDRPMAAVRVNVIPEPATLLLFGFGAVRLLRLHSGQVCSQQAVMVGRRR